MPNALLELIDQLEREHLAVREVLGLLGQLAEAGDGTGLRAALPGCTATLVEGLDEHSSAEDATLFPAVAEALGSGLVAVFATEHAQILALRDELYGGGDDRAILAACLELRSLLESHMDREEGALFPSARDVLDSMA